MTLSPSVPFEALVDLNNYRSILCLNGALPDALFFNKDLPIFAVDGAANTLMDLGVRPTLALGDLDSIRPNLLNDLNTLSLPDQSKCDYEKALLYLKSQNLLPTIVVGVNGGCLDQVLKNIGVLCQTESVLYAPPLVGHVLTAGQTHKWTLPEHTKLSIFGIPSAIVTSRGLKWDLNQSPLDFPGTHSSSNRSQEPTVSLHVTSGTALVLIYENHIIDAGLTAAH